MCTLLRHGAFVANGRGNASGMRDRKLLAALLYGLNNGCLHILIQGIIQLQQLRIVGQVLQKVRPQQVGVAHDAGGREVPAKCWQLMLCGAALGVEKLNSKRMKNCQAFGDKALGELSLNLRPDLGMLHAAVW